MSAVPPRPGPNSRAPAPRACSRIARPLWALTPPSALWRQGRKVHSGQRALTAAITGSVEARSLRPAPARSAPSTASAAAPETVLPHTHSSLP